MKSITQTCVEGIRVDNGEWVRGYTFWRCGDKCYIKGVGENGLKDYEVFEDSVVQIKNKC